MHKRFKNLRAARGRSGDTRPSAPRWRRGPGARRVSGHMRVGGRGAAARARRPAVVQANGIGVRLRGIGRANLPGIYESVAQAICRPAGRSGSCAGAAPRFRPRNPLLHMQHAPRLGRAFGCRKPTFCLQLTRRDSVQARAPVHEGAPTRSFPAPKPRGGGIVPGKARTGVAGSGARRRAGSPQRMDRARAPAARPGMRRMTRERGKAGAARSGGETPRLLLPGDLPRSLRHLDDGQLEELLRAAGAEARRRGLEVAETDRRPAGGSASSGSRRAAAAPAGP